MVSKGKTSASHVNFIIYLLSIMEPGTMVCILQCSLFNPTIIYLFIHSRVLVICCSLGLLINHLYTKSAWVILFEFRVAFLWAARLIIKNFVIIFLPLKFCLSAQIFLFVLALAILSFWRWPAKIHCFILALSLHLTSSWYMADTRREHHYHCHRFLPSFYL